MKEKISSLMAYFVAVISGFFGSIDLNKAAVLIGILATIFTAAVNWYYKRKAFELQEAEVERSNE